MRFFPVLSLGAAGLAVVAPLAAQQTSSRDSSAQKIEGVSVRGARAASVIGGASAVTLRIDSLPVRLNPAPMLADVLRQSNFVLVRQNSRGENELAVRGSDSRQAAVLFDGLPLSVGWDSRTDPSLIPTTGIEQVTVVRGLGTVLGGVNSLGGVIRLDLNDASSAPSKALQLGTGFDQYASRVLSASGSAPVSMPGGTLRVRGGITQRQRDGFALPGGSPGNGVAGGTADPGDADDANLRTNTDLTQLDGFGALRYDHRSGAYLGFTATAYDAERGVAPEQHLSAPRYWRYPKQTRSLLVASLGTGSRATPLGRGAVSASAGRTTQEVQIDAFTNRTYSALSTRELGDETSEMYRVEASHSLVRAAQLRVAGSASRVQYDETLDAQLATARPTRYEQRMSSIGAEVDVPLFSRLLLSGGVTQDQSSTPQTGARTSLGELTRTGWRVGSTLLAADGVRLHASASQRARFAALRELYSGALNRFSPNPDLKPEQLLGIEAGVTLDGGWFATQGLQLQAVGFRHRLDDAVIRITLPNRLFRRINRDEIRSGGVELLAQWTPTTLGGASITADATLQKVRVYDQTITGNANNERRPEHNPEQRASLSLTSPAILGAHASLMGRYTGVQYCQHPDLGRQVELAAQSTADAAVTRAFRVRNGGLLQRLTAVLALDNIADRTAYDQCGLPQPGRTLRFGLTLH
ncbi:MAG: TonB-dependent receptor [Gemmatimonadetes bacterium]|nr:TonB-dependent receptor [Gemmatimonadota bacterium]